MTSRYIGFIIDPAGDNYTVGNELMWSRIDRNLNGSSNYEFGIWNPAGVHNDVFAMDDKVDVHMGIEPLFQWGSVSAFDFDGETYVVVPNHASINIGTTDFTISFKFKISAFGSGTYTILEKGDATDGEFWIIYMTSNGALNCLLYDGGLNATVVSATGFDDGAWHTAIIIADRAGNGQWYVDDVASGAAVDISAVTDIDDGAEDLYIGMRNAGDWYLDGILDEITIHSVLVLATPRTAYYRYGTVQAANLVAYWDLDEGYGSVTTDESANTNNGTITGVQAELAGAYTQCTIDVNNGSNLGTFTADGGTPYSVFSAGDLIVVSNSVNTNDGAYIINTVTNTIITTETVLKGTDNAADAALSIKKDLNDRWVNPKVITGLLTEIEIQRDEYKKNVMVCRGEDYLTIIGGRLAQAGFTGSDDITATLVKLIEEFASGELSTIYTSSVGLNVTNYSIGAKKTLISLMGELAMLPYGVGSFDFYIDGNNSFHWHLRDSALYHSGVTLSGSNIRKFVSRRSTKDKKTHVTVTGAHTPIESTASTHNTVTESDTLHDRHLADDFFAEHDTLISIGIYVQKINAPSVDLIGRVCLAKLDSPSGDFKSFLMREEDISTTAGWITIPMNMPLEVGSRYFIKLNKCGADATHTYAWYGDSPAVLDPEKQAMESTLNSALIWTTTDYDFSMKINYGEPTEIESTDATTPKREMVVPVDDLMDNVTAQLLADQLKTAYLQTKWSASITADAPSAPLVPGSLIILNETESALLSKTYRMETIRWDFGVMRKADVVDIDISSVLPYSNDMETWVSSMMDTILGDATGKLESGDAEGAEPCLIGRAVIGRSAIDYIPG